MTVLRREGADAVRKGRPWSLPLEDRALLVAAYWRTNLTMRQLAPLFGVSKSAADRIIDHLGPMLALQPRKRFAKDTVLIVDGTRVEVAVGDLSEASRDPLALRALLRGLGSIPTFAKASLSVACVFASRRTTTSPTSCRRVERSLLAAIRRSSQTAPTAGQEWAERSAT